MEYYAATNSQMVCTILANDSGVRYALNLKLYWTQNSLNAHQTATYRCWNPQFHPIKVVGIQFRKLIGF